MPDERLCRCPACNPMHHARRGGHRKRELQNCIVCKNTRRVGVDVAERYMAGFNGVSLRKYSKPPLTAQDVDARADDDEGDDQT